MSQDKDRIEQIRQLLKEYDEGQSTYYTCEHDIGALFIEPLLDSIENGEGYMTFGSCCCSSHPPDRTFKAQFTIQAHGFEAKRCK